MSDLMQDGFNLALYGMGFVFFFLILLVFLTSIMSKIVTRFAPAVVIPAKRRAPGRDRAPSSGKSAAGDEAKVIAVIAAAIRQHRSKSD